MMINLIEMLVLMVLVGSLWAALRVHARRVRGTPARPHHLPSATESGADSGMHLCRRGIAPFLKHDAT